MYIFGKYLDKRDSQPVAGLQHFIANNFNNGHKLGIA